MAEVYVTKEAQQYSENLISQYLRDAGYDGSLEDGTSLYDIVVRPAGLIYTLFRQDIDKAYAYMSLAKANELRSVLSEEDYDAAIDGILSNWFVSRNDGRRATGFVRMWFSVPPTFISFTDGQSIGFYDDVPLLARIRDIYAADAKAFIPSDFKSYMNTSNNQTEYYIDLPVIAGTVADVSIPEGAVITVSYTDIYFLRGTAASDFTPGTARESSDAFIERTQEAITTRELITRRAFNTVLPDMFPELSRMYVSGCGDPEMIRDFVTFQTVTVHVGNMADIWVASRLVLAKEECVVHEDSTGTYIELSNSPASVLSIRDTAPDYLVPDSGKYIDLTTDAHAYLWEDGNKNFENQWLIPQEDKTKIYVTLPELTEEEEDAWHDAADIEDYEEYTQYDEKTEPAPSSFSSSISGGVMVNMQPTYGTVELMEVAPGVWEYSYHAESTDELRVYEAGLDTGSHPGSVYYPVSASGSIDFASGADNIVSFTVYYNDSEGVPQEFDITPSGGSIGMQYGTAVFSYSNGSLKFTYTLTRNADHSGDADISEFFSIIALDGDGDLSEEKSVSITIVDDSPSSEIDDTTSEDAFVISVRIDDNLTEYYSIDVYVERESTSYWLSSKRIIGMQRATRVLEVSEITANVAKEIQEFLANDTNRVASFDPQVKMMVPVAMSFGMHITTNVNYANIDSTNYDENATMSLIARIKKSVIEYLEDVKHSDGVYIESEMVKRIHNENSEVSVVHLPVDTRAMLFDMKSGRFLETEVQNRFSLSGFGEVSRQITTNTLQYYTNENLISIELQ